MEHPSRRKQEHVEISTTMDVEAEISAGWEDILFLHRCLPEIDRDEIQLATDFCGRRVERPLVVSALTGGHSHAAGINETLGRLAEHFGLVLEVGSQRPMLGVPSLVETYATARRAAPHACLVANIGAAQLIVQRQSPACTVEQVRELVMAIRADALAIHLNFLQEAVMPEGSRWAKGCTEAIGRMAESLPVPVIVKETGAGISKSQALELKARGLSALDIGGAGGTSMALVESHRAASRENKRFQKLGQTFGGWGIPTAVSVVEAGVSGLPLIASGGIRTGLDAAKALALGASLVGIARPLLGKVLAGGYDEAVEYLEVFFEELAITMFLVGAATPGELRERRLLITGKLKDWLEQLGYDLPQLSRQRA
ncbi:type 2 isopentenyl-diphosphate Delta-isomerase [Chloroflexota bacterium]